MRIRQIACVVVPVLWLIAVVFAVSDAPFTIDELIYESMIRTFSATHSLTIANGWDETHSRLLRLWFLRPGTEGLVPQYPAGFAVIAAPFYSLGGARGVIALNAIASVATAALTWRVARVLFQQATLALNAVLIFLLATFAVNYVFGIWPHALSAFCTTAAVAAVVEASRDECDRAAAAWCFAAGAAIGVGAMVRIDCILGAVPIVVWILAGWRRPYPRAAAFAGGLVPCLLVAAYLNQLKFGVFTPFTYGPKTGGIISVEHLEPLFLIVVLATGGVLLLGLARVRVRVRVLLSSRVAWINAAIVLLLLFVVLEGVRDPLWKLAHGAHALIADMDAYRYAGIEVGVHRYPDGSVRVDGVIKKALLQSAPFLAASLILLPGLFRGEDRRALALLFLFSALWIVPYAFLEAHGGLSTNMRYFTPLLPWLAILTARTFSELAATRLRPSDLVLATGATVFAMLLLSERNLPDHVLLSGLPKVTAAATAFAAVVYLVSKNRRVLSARILKTLMFFGLVQAGLIAHAHDLLVDQSRRASYAQLREIFRQTDERSLIIAQRPESFGFQLARDDGLLANPTRSGRLDPDLVDHALQSGRTVYVQTDSLARHIASAGNGLSLGLVLAEGNHLALYEIVREMAPPMQP